jgi:7-cyano-7-deazaguanine tRNA-ribosyltransferase
MTDSGTFQSYKYGKEDVEPFEIVKFQEKIGSDIGTVLDVFGDQNQTLDEAKRSVKETINRARRSIQFKGEMSIACTVQGSIYPELREKCAKELSKIDSDFFPIGGVVPLMENQKYSDLIKVIISSKIGLDPSKPVHLFGAGHPLVFPIAVALGCDFFDSSAYIKYANDYRMIFSCGTEKLDKLTELPCNCPVCSKYDIDEFKKLEHEEKISEISKHNLYVSFTEIKKIRNAISQGYLWELVERKAVSNPCLIEAINTLNSKQYKEWLEKYEPISKKRALFYTGPHTIHRPIIYRFHNRLLNTYYNKSRNFIIFSEGKKPYSKYYSKEVKRLYRENKDISIVINSALGLIPIELDEIYPIAQSLFPNELDQDTVSYLEQLYDKFIGKKNVLYWGKKNLLKKVGQLKEIKNIIFDEGKISLICDMQFGRNTGYYLLDGDVRIVKSKKTDKIRNVYVNGEHILSMRAGDGFFTLKLGGAKILKTKVKPPKLRVMVNEDSESYILTGKSVFAKFVLDCDPNLRPYDECIIVNERDDLLGVGRCLLNRTEMLSFDFGVAVKTRYHI